jgi:hypothetical protein
MFACRSLALSLPVCCRFNNHSWVKIFEITTTRERSITHTDARLTHKCTLAPIIFHFVPHTVFLTIYGNEFIFFILEVFQLRFCVTGFAENESLKRFFDETAFARAVIRRVCSLNWRLWSRSLHLYSEVIFFLWVIALLEEGGSWSKVEEAHTERSETSDEWLWMVLMVLKFNCFSY